MPRGPECKIAFENPNGPTIWDLLRENPDRYIYDAVKKGAEIPLPKEIHAGIKDVSKRDGWNKIGVEMNLRCRPKSGAKSSPVVSVMPT